MSTHNPADPPPPKSIFAPKRRSPGREPDEGLIGPEAAVLHIEDGPSVTSDPAPSAAAIAEERAQQLVTNISSQMLGELRTLREQIDGLMRDMNERRDLIREAIRAHAQFAETAIQHKVIIAESVDKLRGEFEASRTPLPPVRDV